MLNFERALGFSENAAHLPPVDRLIFILQKCRRTKDLVSARCICRDLSVYGLDVHHALGNFVGPMLVDCGSLSEAQQIFYKLPYQSEFSWTSLIQGYISGGEWAHAFKLFQKMLEDCCVRPSSCTLQAMTKACVELKCVELGQEMHAEFIQEGFEEDPYVGSTLMNMYAKSGLLLEGQRVFDQLSEHNVVLWTVLIGGYADCGLGDNVLNCLNEMQVKGVFPNGATFVCSLKACSSRRDLSIARAIHAEIAKEGFEMDSFVGSALIGAYVKCGSLSEAREAFSELSVRDLVLWNTIISGYAEHGLGDEAFNCLTCMRLEGMDPNEATYMCLLKSCSIIKDVNKGLELHSWIAKDGFETDQYVASTLVDMYAKCGSLEAAQDVLDELPIKCVVAWTALIGGYAEHGFGEEAVSCFQKMKREKLHADGVTILCSLKACSSIRAIELGRELHCEIAKKGLEIDSLVGNTLVDMYAKCGLLLEARQVFDKLSIRTVASWTVLLMGYDEHGLGEEALNCWEKLQVDNVPLDVVMVVCTLKACASIGAIDAGLEIHAVSIKLGFERNPLVGNALVDMYAKCSSLSEALNVFEELAARDVVSWTSIIAAYASQGESKFVFHMFEKMKEEGVCPDGIAYLIVLTVCSRAGFVDKGKKYFDALNKEYGIQATIEHYNCMIDLLGRAGQLNEAMEMLEQMPLQPNLITWNTLMGACQKWGNVELARQTFDCAIKLDRKDAAAFVVMSKIYMDGNMWEDAKKIDALRVNM